jgi:hypothetical protein
MPDTRSRIILEGVAIPQGFRNFSGISRKFNEEGNRNFCVFLDEETAQALKKDGWNVRWLQPRNEEEEPAPILKVKVQYQRRDGTRARPPRIMLITSKGKTPLDEGTVPLLDWAEIISADMEIRPYEYEPGKISAYLHSLWVTIRDDPLEMKS